MGILRSDLLTHSQLSNEGGSIVLDGSGDYLSFAAHSSFAPATADVTFELWFYLNADSDFNVDSADSNYYFFDMGSNGYRIQMYSGLIRFGIDGSTWTPPASGVSKTKWHHVAGVREGNSLDLYLDGKHVGQKSTTASVTSTSLTIGQYGGNLSYNGVPHGYISNFRYVRGVVYRGEFTPPKFELKNIPGTIVLGCQSTTSATDFAVTPSTVTAQGDATASAFHPNLKKDIKDTGVVFDGFGNFATSTYMVPPKGKTTERNRGRAIFSGGYTGPSGSGQTGTTTMEFFNIQSGGRSIEFGTLSEQRKFSAALGSATRGVVGGSDGSPAWVTGTMEFVTIATESNTTTFGNMTAVGGMVSACSNNTRGIFFSVWDPSGSGPSHKGHIDYITIATAGNSADFGELTVNRPEAAGFSSPTRGICAGGYPAADGTTMSNVIDYITIATTGNATDFGDLTQARQAVSGASSQTRGVVAAGAVYASPSYTFNINTIDYVTIASTGDATDFGDLSAGATGKSVGNCSNQIRGVFGGGKSSTPTYINTVEFINIAVTGNAFDFGDLTRTPAYGSVMCDSHGGLS